MTTKRIALATVVRQVDPESRQLVIVGTTKAKDRYGDIVEPRGGDLKAFRRNPVFLWAHEYDEPPIGKSIRERVTDEGIEFTIQFAATEFAQEIFELYRDGFLNAASIGFVPLQWEPAGDTGGRRYTKWELLELSAVPVPANPEALALAVAKGLREEVIREVFVEEKGVIPYGQAHPDGTPKAPEDAEWDAGAEVREADVSDLKVMCAWYDSENPDVKASYKLPHHKASGDHPVVWRGVAAAMAALLGARGGVDIPDSDRRGVYNHLARHYEEFGKEPPEFKAADEIIEEYAQGKAPAAREPAESAPVEKAGAVLAKRNKDRLLQAKALIDEVLADSEQNQQDAGGNDTVTDAAPKAAETPEPASQSNPVEPGGLSPAAIAAYAADVAKREISRLLGKVS